MALLKLYFAGTGGSADELKMMREHKESAMNNAPSDDEVIRIYFSGCHQAPIGERWFGLGYLWPRFNKFVDAIHSCFSQHANSPYINLQMVESLIGSSAIIDSRQMPLWNNYHTSKDCNLIKIDSIHLYGYSRGAIISFILTKKLNELGLPLHVIAEEPVPGETKSHQHFHIPNDSLLEKSYDLSECDNLKSCLVFLGDYALSINPDIPKDYSRQMAPKLPLTTSANIYQLPIHFHTGHKLFDEKHAEEVFNPEKNALTSIYQSIKFNQKNPLVIPNFDEKETQKLLLTKLEKYTPSFLPRFEKKSFHFGVLGRVSLIPSVKEMLNFKYLALSQDKPLEKVSQVRAALAILSVDKKFPVLLSHIKDESGTLLQNAALRDFICETESAIKLFKDKAIQMDNDAFMHLLRFIFSTIEVKLKNLIDDWDNFANAIWDELTIYQSLYPGENVSLLKQYINEVCQYSPFRFDALTPFILEQDAVLIDSHQSLAHQKAYDSVPTSGFEFCRLLFFSSMSRRKLLYQEYEHQFEDLGMTVEELSIVSILLDENNSKDETDEKNSTDSVASEDLNEKIEESSEQQDENQQTPTITV